MPKNREEGQDTEHNGNDVCPISHEWFQHREESKKAMAQIATMYGALTTMLTHTEHLKKLDDLAESRETQIEILKDIRQNLIGPATSKGQTDNETVKLLVKIFGGVFIALLFVFIFLLTGQKYGFFLPH